jgi:hypothetical protein
MWKCNHSEVTVVERFSWGTPSLRDAFELLYQAPSIKYLNPHRNRTFENNRIKQRVNPRDDWGFKISPEIVLRIWRLKETRKIPTIEANIIWVEQGYQDDENRDKGAGYCHIL